PAASTLRDEVAVSGQRLLAASGQIPMAAHTRGGRRGTGDGERGEVWRSGDAGDGDRSARGTNP
ncbi:MAG TPA: hypothetical protein VE575_12785, partial [Acidimicrobiales bacterium]|nr:hypothetical protein [Acidimicrobiales bacterium]